MFDATSIIIQYHLFLALCLVVTGLAGAVIRATVSKKWLPQILKYPEFIIITLLVIVYVFVQV